jgi:Transposase DDE domain
MAASIGGSPDGCRSRWTVRASVPRTALNERAFCAVNHGHSASAKHRAKQRRKNGVPQQKQKSHLPKPQIWLTLVWHMGLRLLWCWRTGPSNSSERSHFQDVLKTQQFPDKALFCGDAGFVGYDLWKLIIDQGHHLLMRVGSNVTLLRKLGYVRESHGIVYCWPNKAARHHQPPLTLRLITMRFGRTPVYLVTSVLPQDELPHEAAKQMYQLRWGIELQFRTIKQTFGLAKLRSKTPDRALRELDWSQLGLWMIQLFAIKEQLAIGHPPTRSSTALAIYAIREVFHMRSEIPTPGNSLQSKLRHAITDTYIRTKKSKRARYRPDNKDKPHAGKPKILTATKQQKLLLKQQRELTT